MSTLSQLAAWMNDRRFRTRNTKNLPDGNGGTAARPRLFTNSSVRGILHHPFFAGMLKHNGQLLPGVHEPLVTQGLFDVVEAALKKNSGR